MNALTRLAAATAVSLLGIGAAAAAFVPAKPARPKLGAAELTVASRLPAWVAPGGRLAVSGWAGPAERLRLVAGSRTLARGTSGRLGRFRLAARAPATGRYRLALVRTDGARHALGGIRVRPVVLAAVGDVTLGDAVASAVAASGPRYPWLSVAPALRAADVATANLEGAVSTRGAPVPDKEFHFRGTPAALAATARFGGLDVVSLANNHTLDYGRDAFADTIRAARAAGLATVGGGADLRGARRPAVVSVGGLRIAFLGYSDVRPLGFDAAPGVPGAAPADPAAIAADVRAARRAADLVVVWFHWGEELASHPSDRQHGFAGDAVFAGASVVLGAHPHVLQPVTRRGRRLVAWSLGNFVFPSYSPRTEQTGILLVRLDARGVVGHRLRPARIKGVQPRLR